MTMTAGVSAAQTTEMAGPPHHSHKRYDLRRTSTTRSVLDWLTGTDPGLLRLRNAVKAVLTIGLTLAAEYVFVHLTHALEVATPPGVLPPSDAAEIAAQHHGVQVIAMLLGAMLGMISSFAVSDPTARGRLITLVYLPFPMVATLTLGLAVGGHRLVSLIGFVVLLTAGTYCRRFGPRGFIGGMLLFFGGFLGFFLHADIAFGQIGWLIADIGVGLLVAIAVNLGPFYPRPASDLRRQQRSWDARARRLVGLADDLVSTPTHRAGDGHAASKRLHRQLGRLSESTLLIDAQLGDPTSVTGGSTAAVLHQRLFDLELALSNVTRFAEALAHRAQKPERRSHIRIVLGAIAAGDFTAAELAARSLLDDLADSATLTEDVELVLLHRFGNSTLDFIEARQVWLGLSEVAAGVAAGPATGQPGTTAGTPMAGAAADQVADEAFVPAVQTFAGWLPGSTLVSATASTSGRRGRRSLAPYTRTAIQMAVAVSAAIAIGDQLSPRRFYWAVIAAFVSFMAANNSAEQVRKAVLRVGGTIGGIFLGGLLAHAVGGDTNLALVVILASLFFAFYLLRINYAFMVLGITVMVSQLYVQLDEYTNTLLVTRLEETAIGAACAIATVLLVLPLRARTVVGIAAEAHFTAVGEVVEVATAVMAGSRSAEELRVPLRQVDAAFQSLMTTMSPLGHPRFRGASPRPVDVAVAVASAARHYSRNLATDLASWPGLGADGCRDLDAAAAVMHSSIAALVARSAGEPDQVYVRSAALLDGINRTLEQPGSGKRRGHLAVRDLQLLDGAMAELAAELGMTVRDFDTTAVPAG